MWRGGRQLPSSGASSFISGLSSLGSAPSSFLHSGTELTRLSASFTPGLTAERALTVTALGEYGRLSGRYPSSHTRRGTEEMQKR